MSINRILLIFVFILSTVMLAAGEENSASNDSAAMIDQLDLLANNPVFANMDLDNATLFDGRAVKMSIVIEPHATNGAMRALVYFSGEDNSTAFQIIKAVIGSDEGKVFTFNQNTSSAVGVGLVAGPDMSEHDVGIKESAGVFSYSSQNGTFAVDLGPDTDETCDETIFGLTNPRPAMDQAAKDMDCLNNDTGAMDCYRQMMNS